jgi:hypothetical protein
MTRRIVFVAIPLTLLLTWYFYNRMGGGDEIIPERIELSSNFVAGEWFEGRPSNSQLEEIFFSMRDVSNFTDSSYLTVINYPGPSIDTIRQFIGVWNTSTGKSRLELQGGAYISVTMDMHSSVRPSPEDVRREAEKLANIEPWEIQLFTSESEIKVLFKVVD